MTAVHPPRSTVFLEKLLATQTIKKFPFFLWNANAHYRIHKSPPFDPILSQMEPMNIVTLSLSKIHFNIILMSIIMSSIIDSRNWIEKYSITNWASQKFYINSITIQNFESNNRLKNGFVSDKGVLTYMQLVADLMDLDQICSAEGGRFGLTTQKLEK
jgi:hypothetical protein